MKRHPYLIIWLLLFVAGSGAQAQETPTLKTIFQPDFLIGVALNEAQFSGRDPDRMRLIQQQFNAITPENVMKWGPIHPLPNQYNFGPADRYVAFGEQHGMFIIGHTLVWHSQTPDWVFLDDAGRPASRELLLQRMQQHITTVVGRYKGRVKGWDVVNEALNEDGTLRQTPWLKIIGEDYLQKAFEFAHAADPEAELYYNDYGLENESKRKGAVALVRRLKSAGIRVEGIGIQEHVNLVWPTTAQLDETLAAFDALGVKVMVTELDVDVLPTHNNGSAEISLHQGAGVNPYTNELPAGMQQKLARRYAGLFSVYLKHTKTLKRVTFWGVTDGDSWLNNWPVRGRTSYPLLFDRAGEPKPCFQAVVQTALQSSVPPSASQ